MRRIQTTEGATRGELHGVANKVFYTLEDVPYLIPAGHYQVIKRYSPKFKTEVLLLRGVKGRSLIEIHPGNTKEDSRGCILVGLSHTEKALGSSREALRQLLARFQEPAELVIYEPS